MEVYTLRTLASGSAERLGAHLVADGVNFALFSRNAQEVYLLLFDQPQGRPTDVIRLEHKTEHIWHVFVHGLKAGQLYGYKVEGDFRPANGLRFNMHKLLLDPYAKALSGPFSHDYLLLAYDMQAKAKDLTYDSRDSGQAMPKCVVIDDAFDWQDDTRPRHIREDAIVYEAHVKGMTASPSSQVKHPGTYLGFIEKIPYLQELGINTVELMPVQEFYVPGYLLDQRLSNYWGYNSVGFFAPALRYAADQTPGAQVAEFKTMVRALHKAKIEVILDVVYNHTAEGNELGPTLCFKGIDNPSYYRLTHGAADEPLRYYVNDAGCGNVFDIEHPAGLRLVLDSLRYWVEHMHVDGFRFDLATVLGRNEGRFDRAAAFFLTVAQDPVLQNAKLIAEPWDLTTYQLGQFPTGWAEWNGRYRDTMRRFNKGDEGQADDFAKRLCGSADLYADHGRNAYESINFITCHDGFTLMDLYSYNEKHNEANAEDNKDGMNENYSWNCGIEGPSTDKAVLDLRRRLAKNAVCLLMFSCGTPMLLAGDEFLRTQSGNNNAWCQDNPTSWMDWQLAQRNQDMLSFVQKAIAFRKENTFLGRQIPEVVWYGKDLKAPAWHNPKLRTLMLQCQGGDGLMLFIYNASHRGSVVRLPPLTQHKWHRLVDTAQRAGEDFRAPGRERLLRRQDKHYCAARSVMVMVAKPL